MQFFKKNSWLTGILIGIPICLILYWFSYRDSDAIRQLKALERIPRATRTYEESAVEKIRYEMTETGNRRIVGDLTFEQKLALLREKWGNHITKPYAQVKMLEEIINICKKEQPDNWVACTNELAGAAFPKLADKLFGQLSSLITYNDWLTRNKGKLDKMSRKDRQNLLKDMRNQLFGGDNAKEVWAHELKVEALRDTLEDMKDIKDKDIATKLSYLKNTLKENFGDQAKAYVDRHQQELTNSVMAAVQDDLKALSPTQQRHALRTIRTEMGMDSAALERWETLDNERQDRWNSGKTYLLERQKLLARPDAASEAELNDLRRKYFGAEADAIAVEEAEGYYRYQGNQRLGLE
jgi:Fe-S cluster biosynthesis and repair protein YggX